MMFPIQIRRNLEYESRNGEPRYYLEVDLNELVANRTSTLLVYWRPNKSHPILKEIYHTEIGGFRVEKGNLAALVNAVPEVINTLVDHSTLPYYSITLPSGSKIPVYLAKGKLQTKVDGVEISGSDIGEVYHRLSKHLISSKILKDKNEIAVNIFIWRDLKLYPPAFVFCDGEEKTWIPIFYHENDSKTMLNYDVVGQPSRILGVKGLFNLRSEIIDSLISAKAISSPYSIYMDRVKDEVLKAVKKIVKPLDQHFIYDTASKKVEIPVYSNESELIAVSRSKIYFGKDIEQLRSKAAEELKKEGLIQSLTALKVEKKKKEAPKGK